MFGASGTNMLPPEDEAEVNSSPSTYPARLTSMLAPTATPSSTDPGQMSPTSSGTAMARQSGFQAQGAISHSSDRASSPTPGQARPTPLLPDTSSIIAHSPSTAANPSATTTSRLSSSPANIAYSTVLSTRRAACTHLRLTRIYGNYKCHHCGRVPRLGWVYRCTQDLGDDLVGFRHREEDNFTAALQRRLQQESEARSQLPQIIEDVEPSSSRGSSRSGELLASPVSHPALPTGQDDSSPELKPWMNKLVVEGFYSDDQIKTLKNQRRLVLERVAASAHPEPPSQSELQDLLIADPITLLPGPGSTHYSRRYRRSAVQTTATHPTTTIAPYWQTPNQARQQIQRTQRDQLSNTRTMSVFGPHGVYTSSDQQIQHAELQQPSVCVYQTCSTCRPITRDRTWMCLHPSHFDTTGEPLRLPSPAIDNRPVSHPTLVQSACYKIFHPIPINTMMSSSTYTSGDISDYDEDDDDFDLTTSGYDSSEISPDNSSEGTPTIPYFDEHRGWDPASRWMAPAPTPPSAPFRFGQPMQAPSIAFGNPLSGYGPTFPGQRRILRRASSMDPRMLRSAREMAEMADIGLVGLGLAIGNASNDTTRDAGSRYTGEAAQAGSSNEPTQHQVDQSLYEDDNNVESREEDRSLSGSYSRSGAVSALDLRPSLDEQLTSSSSSFPAPGNLGDEAGEEMHVGGGIAVTEESVESGEPDIVLSTHEYGQEQEQEQIQDQQHKEEEDEHTRGTFAPVALFG